jgi:hypothetical protein
LLLAPKSGILTKMSERDKDFAAIYQTHTLEFFKKNLLPERFETALKTYKILSSRKHHDRNPFDFALLLQEQYETQLALKLLNITASDNPSHLPEINRVLPPRTLITVNENIPLIVEVMGPPSIGKTSLIERSQTNIDFYYRPEIIARAKSKFRDYIKRSEEQLIKQDPPLAFEGYKKILNDEIFEVIKLMNNGKSKVEPIVADRWLIDANIFGRAFYALGKLGVGVPRHYRSYASPLDQTEEILGTPFEEDVYSPRDLTRNEYDFQYALIMCLAAPKTSTERGYSGNTDKFISTEDLPNLYEQYLRIHCEMLFHRRPFTYACVDLSSNDKNANQLKFNQILKTTLDFYNRNKQYDYQFE